LPMMMPPIVVGDLWKFILTPQGGVLNYLLGRVGIGPELERSRTRHNFNHEHAYMAVGGTLACDRLQWPRLYARQHL